MSAAILVLALLAACGEVLGTRLETGPPRAGAQLGNALAADERGAFVGAWKRADAELGPEVGAVVAFEREADGWRAAGELAPRERFAGQRFGASLALRGDVLLVGAPGHPARGPNGGAVHAFAREDGAWREVQLLHARDGDERDAFGYSIAIDGARALIGAIGQDASGRGAGAAYLFERRAQGWEELARLRPDDPAAGALFGHAVALAGELALVGAHRDGKSAGAIRGAVYVFRREMGSDGSEAWRQVQKLYAPDETPESRFGHALDLDGSLAVIADRRAAGGGRVYVYEVGARELRLGARLLSPAEAPGEFGWALELRGDTLLVGDRYDSSAAPRAGAAWRFTRGDDGRWAVSHELRGAPAEAELGVAVTHAPGGALAGAWRAGPEDAGAAYAFALR